METISNTDRNGGKRRQNPSRQKTENRGTAFGSFLHRFQPVSVRKHFGRPGKKRETKFRTWQKPHFTAQTTAYFLYYCHKGHRGETIESSSGQGFFRVHNTIRGCRMREGAFSVSSSACFFWRHAPAETVSHISGEKRKKNRFSPFFGERTRAARAMQKIFLQHMFLLLKDTQEGYPVIASPSYFRKK